MAIVFRGCLPRTFPTSSDRRGSARFRERCEGEALALRHYQSHERMAFLLGMALRVILHSWPGVRCSIWC